MRIISGKYKGKILKGFNIDGTRPTMDRVKESLFGIIQNNIKNSICLDLFAGSGIVGIEAASRGAREVFFVEKNPNHYKLLKSNLKSIEFDYKSFNADSTKILEKFENKKFDIIFSDPPYKTDLNNKIIEIISKKNLLAENGYLVIECNKAEDYTEMLEKNGFEQIKEKIYGDTKVLYIK